MSKALCLAQAVSTRPSDGPLGSFFVTVLAAGLWTLAVWILVRALRPRKLLLVRAPGRANHAALPLVVGVYFVYQLATLLVAQLTAHLLGVPVRELPFQWILPSQIAGQAVGIALSLTLAAMTFRHGLSRGLGLTLRHPYNDLARGVVGTLAVIPPTMGLLLLAQWLIERGWLPLTYRLHPVLEFLPKAGAGWVAVAVLSAVVLAPLAEEIFFRGLLQSSLKRHFRNPWPAVLIASAVFALVHVQQVQDMPSLLVLGVALGYNYERTGRLGGPILMHAFFNTFSILNTLLQVRG